MRKRRGHGEGNIYQRADGVWAARIGLGWEDGKYRRKAVYGKTQAEVRRKLAAIIEARDDGDYISSTKESATVVMPPPVGGAPIAISSCSPPLSRCRQSSAVLANRSPGPVVLPTLHPPLLHCGTSRFLGLVARAMGGMRLPPAGYEWRSDDERAGGAGGRRPGTTSHAIRLDKSLRDV